MQDLNDLRLFAEVVRHKGFSPAARAVGAPKSKLSKHVAGLESQLGVRLIERTTRRFRVTDVGQEFYLHCEAVLAGVEAAEAVVARAQAEPRGVVRISCPHGLSHGIMAAILPAFLARHPLVRIDMKVLNRRVDLIEERFDIALRVRDKLDTDPTLTLRILGRGRVVLVASPGFAADHHALLTIDGLASLPTLSSGDTILDGRWDLTGPNGEVRAIVHKPRLCCGDFNVLREAAVAGLGVALLPDLVCNAALEDGSLVNILPDWQTSQGIVHMVFAAKDGLLPAVRALIDHVAKEFPATMQRCYAADRSAAA